MKINSLNTYISDDLVIINIDECLLQTSNYLKKNNLNPTAFFTYRDLYNKNKRVVINSAALTSFGNELKNMLRNNQIDPYKIIIYSRGINVSTDILNQFNIPESNIFAGMHDEHLLQYLNNLTVPALFVDWNEMIIRKIDNKNVRGIKYIYKK